MKASQTRGLKPPSEALFCRKIWFLPKRTSYTPVIKKDPIFMAASQQHGFQFERLIFNEVNRRLGRPESSPLGFQADPTARYDLPAWQDPTGAGIPTSIKMARRSASGRVRVDLADARRTVGLAEVPMLRLLVGVYEQKSDVKVINEVREYLIPGDRWAEATGDVPVPMIARYHADIKEGSPTEARAKAKEWKKKLDQYYPGIVRWAAKIDSKNQRRLQCSVYLDELEDLLVPAKDAPIHVYGSPADADTRPPKLKPVNAALWGERGLAFPVSIQSPPRQRNPKAVAAENPEPAV